MTDLELSLRQLVRDLDAEGVIYALVGGLAVSARSEPRLTRDADFAVSTNDDFGAEEVTRALVDRGYRIDSVLEHEPSERIASVRLVHPNRHEVILDLLFASCGIEDEIADQAEILEVLPELLIPLARTGHLIAMKLLAQDDRHRPTDSDDIRSLLAIATPSDLADARAAVRLITERGFNRGRDLERALDFALRQPQDPA